MWRTRYRTLRIFAYRKLLSSHLCHVWRASAGTASFVSRDTRERTASPNGRLRYGTSRTWNSDGGSVCHGCLAFGKWSRMTPYTWAEKFESFKRIKSIRETNGNFDSCNSCKRLAVYMSCMSQNFRLFHASNLSVRNFRIFLLMHTGSVIACRLRECHEL